MSPVFPCREMSTRHCPAGYLAECGPNRPCARYESEDPAPWLPELPDHVSDIGAISRRVPGWLSRAAAERRLLGHVFEALAVGLANLANQLPYEQNLALAQLICKSLVDNGLQVQFRSGLDRLREVDKWS
jgi:hypothetical protein